MTNALASPPATRRLDASSLTPEDEAMIVRLLEIVNREEKASLVGKDGVPVALPDQVYHGLARVIRAMQEKQSVLLVPEEETVTTQAAAEMLGVSRPHVIELLERGAIPFHKVGTHRRLFMRDVRAYEKGRDASRRTAFDALSAKVAGAGLYFKGPQSGGTDMSGRKDASR